MSTIKKSSTRIKLNGMTFLHYSKCDAFNSFPKEYVVSGGVTYFRAKDKAEVADDVMVDQFIDLPDMQDVEELDVVSMEVSKEGKLTVAEPTSEAKPSIIEHPSGKKMKRRFLNPTTGNYVSYVREVQLGINKG